MKRRSIGVGGAVIEDNMSLSLSSLGVPRSKSFELPESPVKIKVKTRSFGCGTADTYKPMLNRATNTDAPVPIPRKEVGVATMETKRIDAGVGTLKTKLVDVGVEADINPRSAESVHTCDKCSAVIKGVARDVLNRSREAVGQDTEPAVTQSRIPRFTGSSQTSPSPSMTSSLTLPSPGSTQRKFMRQDTYTKIPSKSSPESPKSSASQRLVLEG